MRKPTGMFIGAAAGLAAVAYVAVADDQPTFGANAPPGLAAIRTLAEGRDTFRHDTFANEDFWGGQLGLHRAIAGAANGGVGAGLSPKAALGLGLKVDSEQLPTPIVRT